jgi:hypothetical protein
MPSRLQDKTSTFKGPMDVLKQVIRKHGLLGLYAGMESTFWRYVDPNYQLDNFISCRFRHVYWNGGYFGCIHEVKTLLPKPDVRAVLFFRTRSKFYHFCIEPTSATHEQLRVWCYRWFCRYRVEYTVSH